jgi:glutamate formiminotransferase / 5-formyltetrahydrofolate cyclo-ligase
MCVLECVINVSEGRRADVVSSVAGAAGGALWDVHSDAHHHRSVLTLGGPDVEPAARAVAGAAVEALDLRTHEGVHPRIGVVDVVPFVPLQGSVMADAVAARDAFASWMASSLAVPCFLYGPDRALPDVRRGAFIAMGPDVGPASPHPTAGACAVGAREVLVAYNVWLAPGVGVDVARAAAAALRRPGAVRALGMDVGGRAQVSCNLLAAEQVGPAEVYDIVASMAAVDGGELVGLAPLSVLKRVPRERWAELDLSSERTIESRL